MEVRRMGSLLEAQRSRAEVEGMIFHIVSLLHLRKHKRAQSKHVIQTSCSLNRSIIEEKPTRSGSIQYSGLESVVHEQASIKS